MRTIAIINQKGGCGKTTSAINIAGVLAKLGHRTLLVDLDPQSHCAAGLGIPEEKIDLDSRNLLLANGKKLDEGRLFWRISRNLDLIPSSMKLAGLEAARGGLAEAEDRDRRLTQALTSLQDRYDFCLVDCPPAIGLLTYNALRAATEALIPVETSFFAMRGAARQIKTISSLARRLGGKTPYRILATMHDPDSRLAVDLLEDLRESFPSCVIPHVIRLDSKLREAATFGQPLIEYEAAAAGARDYADVAVHIVENMPGKRRGRQDAGVRGSVQAEKRTEASDEQVEVDLLEEAQARAVDLASRVRKLLAQSAHLQSKLSGEKIQSADAAPTATIAEPKPTPTPPSKQPSIRSRLASMCGVRETPRGMVFSHPASPGSRVFLAGDFNAWSAHATPLRFNEASQAHETCVDLPPGRCEYRFVVDGQWIADPHNETWTTNPYGDCNSVVVVTRKRTESLSREGAD